MDRLETMRIFVAVAEQQGFAAAARRLSLSPPVVTRAIAALEDRVGTRLLHRTTRQVRLTDAGERFLVDSRKILAAIEEAEQAVALTHDEPRGLLSVTASVTFGRKHLAPLLLAYAQRHPHVRTRALFVDRLVDLLDEGIDVAVRIAHLSDSSLTAVRVGSVRRVVCASPDYLERCGVPRTPADLDQHSIVLLGGEVETDWHFGGPTPQSMRVRARLTSSLADVALNAALSGHGLTRLLSYVVEPELAQGRLVAVLTDYEPVALPVNVLYLEGRAANAKVRYFVDFAVEHLRQLRLR